MNSNASSAPDDRWRKSRPRPVPIRRTPCRACWCWLSLDALIARESQRIENGLGVLSVVATASPFIGLFGTVWGIMNAFSAIASAGNTNLTTVAPAIAEALFATAIGLAAAIPAYMAYNKFSIDGRSARSTSRL